MPYPITETPDPLALVVDTRTAARMIGVAEGTLENMRYRRDRRDHGPEYCKIGGKIVYPVSGLHRYIEERMVKRGDR